MSTKRTIVLMGNGKSIADLDLDQLNKVDTIGVNGAFVMYEEKQWFPTYFAMLRSLPQFWGGPGGMFENFMTRYSHKFREVFVVRDDNTIFDKFDNVRELVYTPVQQFSPNPNVWSDSKLYDVTTAFQVLEREIGQDMLCGLIADFDGEVDETWNWRGIYKQFKKTGVSMNSGDFIKKPRWIPDLEPPESFDRFVYDHGSAGYVTAHICRLLGYNKILLVGFDCNYHIDKNGIVDVAETFGIPGVFGGRPYDVAIDYKCPSCRNDKYLLDVQLASWKRMSAMITMHNLDLEIVNCTPGSKLLEFPMSTLEKELK
jgi:hypothetical protein